MANKPGEANFFPDVPTYPEIGTFQPIYGKFDLTTYIQGASDYEIMAFLVGKYNATLEAYGTVTKLSTETIEAAHQLQDWINSWFNNLDVQQELNNKIDQMVADGSFGTLLHQTFDAQINQQTTNAVTTWLVANVTPTGSAVIVDKSLSIENAAADAKATGNLRNKATTIENNTDLNTCTNFTTNYVAPIGYSFINSPVTNRPFILYAIPFSSIVIYQVLTTMPADIDSNIPSEQYIRVRYNDVWSNWHKVTYRPKYIDNTTDLDTLNDPETTYITQGEGTPNNSPYPASSIFSINIIPFNVGGIYWQVTKNLQRSSDVTRIYKSYTRMWDGSKWSAWSSEDKTVYTYIDNTTDLDTLNDPETTYITQGEGTPNNSPYPASSIFSINIIPFNVGGIYWQVTKNLQRSSDVTRIYKSYTRMWDGSKWSAWSSEDKTVSSINPFIDIWKNKIINCLGDSLTYGDRGASQGRTSNPWPSLLNNYLPVTANNYGINSTTLAGTGEQAFVQRYTNMDNCDCVIVWGGTNDFEYNITLGVMGDTTTSTFYGGLDYLIKGLYTKYGMTIKIVFITPPKFYQTDNYNFTKPNSQGKYESDYVNAIKQVCDYYSIPVFDMYTESEMTPVLDDGTYRPDKLHFSDAGYAKLAERIANFLMNH